VEDSVKTEIIYEDTDLFVVRKPPGLATQTARINQADVVSELKNYRRNPYLGVVHRLDQPVEGLLVFAGNKKAAAALSAQLRGGTLNKRYYAIICGKPDKAQGKLTDYLYKDNIQTGRAIIVEEQEAKGYPEAKKAVLQYKILQYIEEKNLSLAEIHIDTGRFHQIRAQMAHAGMALAGDRKYAGEAARRQSEALGIDCVALCAYSLEFLHPVSGKEMRFQIKPSGHAFSCFSL